MIIKFILKVIMNPENFFLKNFYYSKDLIFILLLIVDQNFIYILLIDP